MSVKPVCSADRPAHSLNRTEPWRIAVMAPQPLMRDLLARWLARLDTPCQLAASADAAELKHLLRQEPPPHAVVVGGLGVPWRELLAMLPPGEVVGSVPLILVPDSDAPELVTAALRQGVRGVVPTALEPGVAAAAVHLVLSGGTYMPAHHLRAAAAPAAGLSTDCRVLTSLGLTQREAEVVGLLQRGLSNRSIARSLGISESTVVVHVRNLMQKLSATNRAQAVYRVHQRLRERHQAPPAGQPLH